LWAEHQNDFKNIQEARRAHKLGDYHYYDEKFTICKQNFAFAYEIHGKDGYYLRNRLQDMENNLNNKFTWLEYTLDDASM